MNFGGGEKIEETVSNITNEIMVVGSIYRNPDLIVEYSQYIKSKYDFSMKPHVSFMSAQLQYSRHALRL